MEFNKNPLQYFEDLLESDKTSKLKELFISECIEELGSSIESIDNEKGIIKYWNNYSDEITNTHIEGLTTAHFEKNFTNTLYTEFQKSKNLIDEYVINNPTNYLPFLYLQERILQYSIHRGQNTILKFPIILKPILGIQRYINEKYLYDQERKINLDLNKVENVEIIKENNYTDVEIIEMTLGYLKGYNDKREKIMSDEYYNLMISYITYYIENNLAPENIQKIPSINIPKNLLSYTFWVLHNQLYSTTEIKQDFLHFLKNMFSDFDNWKFSTLKSKFGGKDKVRIRGVKFIPEIIKLAYRNS